MMKSCLLALWFAALAANAIGQLQAPTAGWDSLSRLAPRTETRVFLSGGRTVRGSLQTVNSDSIAINSAKGQEILPRPQIRKIQSRRKGHRGRNALIGLGIGAGGGVAIGAAVDSSSRGGWFPNLGKAAFTPLGAIVGTIVGVAIPSGGWIEIYRAP